MGIGFQKNYYKSPIPRPFLALLPFEADAASKF